MFCCIPSISSHHLPARALWTLKPGSKTTRPRLFAAGRELASAPQSALPPAKKGPVRPSPHCRPACCLRRGRRFGRLDGNSFLHSEQPSAQGTGTQTGTASAAPGASRYSPLPTRAARKNQYYNSHTTSNSPTRLTRNSYAVLLKSPSFVAPNQAKLANLFVLVHPPPPKTSSSPRIS